MSYFICGKCNTREPIFKDPPYRVIWEGHEGFVFCSQTCLVRWVLEESKLTVIINGARVEVEDTLLIEICHGDAEGIT